jgi:uncharacterized protein (DUF362 family)/NAD-dependent dihydropyrimidine dehydrogenase PreA subunit
MKVSITKCDSYEEQKVLDSIKKSLDLINYEIPKNKKILLKPNVLGFYPGPNQIAITTHLSVIKAVMNLFKDNTLFIGDSTGQGTTEKALKNIGLYDLKNIKIVNFDKEEKVPFNFNGTYLKEEHIPKIINEVDLIINLPKLKTHTFTKYTGAIKNLYGIIPGGKKWSLHHQTGNELEFSKMLLDIFKKIKPSLNIMDGIIGMEGNGPSMGKPKKANIILASEDALSLDVTASEIIGYNSQDINVIELAYKENLNSEIEVLGEKNIKIPFEQPSTASQGLVRYLPRFLKKKIFDNKKLEVDKEKCLKCGICDKICPVDAITYTPYPVWDFKKCIRCHCCIETCPHHAIFLEEDSFGKGLKLLRKLKNFRFGNSGTIYKD